MKTISGKVVEKSEWKAVDKSKCTEEFLHKMRRRRAKNRVARKSRRANR